LLQLPLSSLFVRFDFYLSFFYYWYWILEN